jgi:hypothetical protein
MSPSAISLPVSSVSDLPAASSPSLVLDHPTSLEKKTIWSENGLSWRGALPLEAYFRREVHLSSQALTRNGGITHWVLVDRDDPSDGRKILASCETIRKKALVFAEGKLQQVITHSIGSVFCEMRFRKRGYAGRMMSELGKTLRTWQTDPEIEGREECLFTVLYSDIGKVREAGTTLLVNRCNASCLSAYLIICHVVICKLITIPSLLLMANATNFKCCIKTLTCL